MLTGRDVVGDLVPFVSAFVSAFARRRMASLVLLVASSALANSNDSTYNYVGLYNSHNNEVLTPSGYATVKLCKAADPTNCAVGSFSFSCSCDVREFVDEVNTRRCMHSSISTNAAYDFRAITWNANLAGHAAAHIAKTGFGTDGDSSNEVQPNELDTNRMFTVMVISPNEAPNVMVERLYSSDPGWRGPVTPEVRKRMVYPGVHSIGCALGIDALVCAYGYNTTTADVPCEPTEHTETGACYDCNLYDGRCATLLIPVNPTYNRATCLACAQGDYTDKVSTPGESAGAPEELTDLAIALIVIFSLFVLVVLIVVVYKWKQILHWLAPFRPSLYWMKSETKASNVALARHETHIKVKRDTIKEFSKTKSIRHTMTMPVYNAHVDVAPNHPHGSEPQTTKAAHEHEMPPTYQSSARAKAASMRSRSVRLKGSGGAKPVELGDAYL